MRIRTVKPEFFTDSKLSEFPALCRLLFIGLWCEADREGRLKDVPKELKVKILPYDSCNVDKFLDTLQVANLIVRYEHNNSRYIQIINFLKHQRPNSKENQSVIPVLNLDEAFLNLDKGTLNPELVEGKGKEGKGKERERNGKGTGKERASATEDCISAMESEFPDMDVKTELKRWEDYHRAKGSWGQGIKDFNASFRTWMRSPFQKKNKEKPNKFTGLSEKDYTKGIDDDGNIL